jgi:hypothetical protein
MRNLPTLLLLLLLSLLAAGGCASNFMQPMDAAILPRILNADESAIVFFQTIILRHGNSGASY